MRQLALSIVALIPACLFGSGGTPAFANDTSAELSVGGLVFTRSSDVSLESEDLTITPDLVTVKYRFLNHAPTPVTLTIAFPLPDIDLSESDNYSIPTLDPANFVGFETKIDGAPIKFTIHQSAFLGSQDVSAALRALGVPLLPIGAQETRLADLPQATREQLIKQGLLLPNGTDDQGHQLYEGAWTVKTAVVRQQTFPPNHPVTVEHRYHTSVGMSFDTVLRKGLRLNKAMTAEVERYRKEYCIGDAFLASLDRLAGDGKANTAKIQERRISYVLKTGANWAGPIKDFNLTVDRQNADRLISFCPNQTTATSPTLTQFTAKDFTPDRDLKILIVGKF
jgi:hypothetical protein